MIQKIFRSVFLAMLLVLATSILLFVNVLYNHFSGIQKLQLREQANLISLGVADLGLEYLQNLESTSYRITWIDTDGSILFDNRHDSMTMENHLDREEVRRAVTLGHGESNRYSKTLMEKYFYYAKRQPDRTVIRLSQAQGSTLSLLLQMQQPLFIVFGLSAILALVLAYRISGSVVKPLNMLNLDDPLSNRGYDEISPLLHRINNQQLEIQRHRNELRQKQLEFEAVTDRLREGLILLNEKQIILSINRSALRILDTTVESIGHELQRVNRHLVFSNLLLQSGDEKYRTEQMQINGKEYLVSANPIVEQGHFFGTVLLLQDSQEKAEAEQLRREFTANVSHELKTPLHAISGYLELLSNSMVKSEDIPLFSQRIYNEAQRLIHLVESIIKLSRLDEGQSDLQREDVDLFALSKSVLDAIEPKAASADISLRLQGDSARIFGYPHLLYEIIYNLCDNAIKYNKDHGYVIVEIKNQEQNVLLTVFDSGIGIIEEDQARVFERFYRVDKSHSKKIGGSGLGLSIVKHAAKLHNAKIELHSKLGEGTTISVLFPK